MYNYNASYSSSYILILYRCLADILCNWTNSDFLSLQDFDYIGFNINLLLINFHSFTFKIAFNPCKSMYYWICLSIISPFDIIYPFPFWLLFTQRIAIYHSYLYVEPHCLTIMCNNTITQRSIFIWMSLPSMANSFPQIIMLA